MQADTQTRKAEIQANMQTRTAEIQALMTQQTNERNQVGGCLSRLASAELPSGISRCRHCIFKVSHAAAGACVRLLCTLAAHINPLQGQCPIFVSI